jgi:hypothetical protein
MFGGSAASARSEHCAAVHGRYAIYANNDYLWVTGSKHRLVVVIDALDKRLQELGWEQTAAYGKFVICSDRAVDPLRLTNQDEVRVKSYSAVRFVRR